MNGIYSNMDLNTYYKYFEITNNGKKSFITFKSKNHKSSHSFELDNMKVNNEEYKLGINAFFEINKKAESEEDYTFTFFNTHSKTVPYQNVENIKFSDLNEDNCEIRLKDKSFGVLCSVDGFKINTETTTKHPTILMTTRKETGKPNLDINYKNISWKANFNLEHSIIMLPSGTTFENITWKNNGSEFRIFKEDDVITEDIAEEILTFQFIRNIHTCDDIKQFKLKSFSDFNNFRFTNDYIEFNFSDGSNCKIVPKQYEINIIIDDENFGNYYPINEKVDFSKLIFGYAINDITFNIGDYSHVFNEKNNTLYINGISSNTQYPLIYSESESYGYYCLNDILVFNNEKKQIIKMKYEGCFKYEHIDENGDYSAPIKVLYISPKTIISNPKYSTFDIVISRESKRDIHIDISDMDIILSEAGLIYKDMIYPNPELFTDGDNESVKIVGGVKGIIITISDGNLIMYDETNKKIQMIYNKLIQNDQIITYGINNKIECGKILVVYDDKELNELYNNYSEEAYQAYKSKYYLEGGFSTIIDPHQNIYIGWDIIDSDVPKVCDMLIIDSEYCMVDTSEMFSGKDLTIYKFNMTITNYCQNYGSSRIFTADSEYYAPEGTNTKGMFACSILRPHDKVEININFYDALLICDQMFYKTLIMNDIDINIDCKENHIGQLLRNGFYGRQMFKQAKIGGILRLSLNKYITRIVANEMFDDTIINIDNIKFLSDNIDWDIELYANHMFDGISNKTNRIIKINEHVKVIEYSGMFANVEELEKVIFTTTEESISIKKLFESKNPSTKWLIISKDMNGEVIKVHSS